MIASFTFAAVAENVKIHGKITDQEEKPVEFATIRIAGTSIGTNSDLEGNYSLTVAPKDTLEVIYSCIGFKNVTRRLIDPEGELTINVKLPTESTELAEVEVTGFRQNINGMQSIDKESFKTCSRLGQESIQATK